MKAMIQARNAPTARPTTMTSGSEFTLRANTPIIIPAIMPFMVDPITMPTMPLRTAGVNHAVRPSRAPRIPPNIIPSTILFVIPLLPVRDDVPLIAVLPALAGTFNHFRVNHLLRRSFLSRSVPRKKNKQHTHKQIRQHQHHGNAIAVDQPDGPLEKIFLVGADCHVVKVSPQIGGKLLH